jgi:DNA-binding CsgD family transcriptional regulator
MYNDPMSHHDEQELPLAEPLTPREKDILHCLGDGMSNRQIAEQLTLSLNTVKWYVRQVYNKLGVSSRGDAVARAMSLGLLPAAADLSSRFPSLVLCRFTGRAGLKRLQYNVSPITNTIPNCHL